MNRRKQVEQFAKTAVYMLGRRPDEFGLIPDDDGYVVIKEFIKAAVELQEWKHIRLSHVTEISLMLDPPPVEIDSGRIRTVDGALRSRPESCPDPPRLLYTCISRKSHPVVNAHGIRPTYHHRVISTPDPNLAVQWGKRRDSHPVSLTIQTAAAMEKGIGFYRLGEYLFLSDAIPPECFTGPPLPKESFKEKAQPKIEPLEQYARQTRAGTFFLNPSPPEPKSKSDKKDRSWKHHKKRLRRNKTELWPDDDV
jgi:putative RNA 2'-phosphotransferase